MKLTVLLLILTIAQASARVEAQSITLRADNISLEDVFKEIRKQTGYEFLYNANMLRDAKKVNENFEHTPVKEALDMLFQDQPLTYTLTGKTIVMKRKPGIKNDLKETEKAEMEIQGTVVDSTTGEPLAGVTVRVQGTHTGTVTDGSGRFSLEAEDDAVLDVSFVGYSSKSVSVNGKQLINISLSSSATGLDQLVVIGYGSQKKADITGAVANFDASNLGEQPITRVDQALAGQMAGVHVTQTTGIPGKAFSIQVRGSGSISAGNEPLYVIDGFPLAQASPDASGDYDSGNPLDNINPNDIQSIQVLKDAAAAAIYGSRAANGVVLITTKRGKSGKAKISLNAYAGVTKRMRKLDMLNPSEWVDRSIEMINHQWITSAPGRTADQTTAQRKAILGLSGDQVNPLLMIDDRWLEPGHPGLEYMDWQNAAFRTGYVQNYELSASGGNDYVNYYLSGDYDENQGIVIGMKYTSYSARTNIEVTPNKKLNFGINIAPSYSIGLDPGVEGKDNILQQLLLFTPVQEDTMGLYPNAFNNESYKWGTTANSPIAKLEENIGQTKKFRTLASIYAQYEIIPGLFFKSTANLDNINSSVKEYSPYTVAGPLSSRLTQPGVGTQGSYLSYRKQTFVNENTLSYKKLIKDVHNISVLLGTSYNSDKLDNVSLSSRDGFGSSVITTLNAATTITGSTTETKDVLLSYFGRLQYSYNDKYLLSASLRRDGSSRFGADTKWGWFPSASLGWRISREPFLKDNRLIDDLKFRISWGKSGNYSIGDYSSIPLLETDNYTFGSMLVHGQAPSGIVNPDLSWEASETYDAGIDFSILGSRISGALDYYDKTSTDLLLNVAIPAVTGFPTYLSNAGKVRNRGWEVELSTHNTVGVVKWTTSVNLSHNENQVLALTGGQDQIFIPSEFDIPHSILKVGDPMYSIDVVKKIGVLSQEDIDKGAALFGSETVGDPKYLDANGDGVINADDRVIVGHPNPDYVWGITNTITYKEFDLTFLVQGQWGGSIYSLLGRAIDRTGQDNTGNVLGVNRYRWRSADDPGNGNVGKAYSTFGRIKNTDWLYSSNYWRVANITLGYNLGKLIKSGYVNSARIYLTANNWFGKDKYYGGMNPEAANTDLSGSSSFPEAGDYGGLPLSKSLIVGVNFTF